MDYLWGSQVPKISLKARLRAPSTESLFVATIVLFGFRLCAHPIGDNSMFAHLRTGIDMTGGLGIPRHDVYSYTAHGEPWVVQSWLAEWTYGWFYRRGGLQWVILEQAAITALLAWVVVRLARAGTPLRTALGGVVAVGAGAAYWTQRPLLFGLLCFALLVTVVERGHSPWWLVPLVWVWVNTHGSFPLGLAWLAARFLGEGLDERRIPRGRLRYGVAFVVGLAVSAINPLGPRLLGFALTVGDKRHVFEQVVEWRSPNFQHADGLFTLAFLLLGVLIVLRKGLHWRDALPIVGFIALGLIAVRNLPLAAIVLAPAVGRSLRVADGSERQKQRGAPRLNAAFAAVLALGYLVFALSGTSGKTLDTHSYPVAAVTYLERQGLLKAPHRIAHQDTVGDYLILRYGRSARVFVDDRYDMYPTKVSDDFTTLIGAGHGALDVLRRRDIDVVLWDRSAALPALLKATGEWKGRRFGAWEVLQKTS